MDLPRVARGSTAASFRKKIEIAPTNETRKTCWDMDGDSPGPTIAGSFTTAPRRVQMASRGVNGRSWCGGTKQNWNGPDWIIRTTRKRLLPINPQIRSEEHTSELQSR